VQTIFPLSSLPAIASPVLIDGFSQPGYSGTPLIEINGSQAGGVDGLLITGPDVTVRGLDINSFQGAGIHMTGASATGNWICGDFLGTDPTGTQAEPNGDGVEIDGGASDNLVGTNGDGTDDEAERNILSGNQSAGVSISGVGADGNVVAGNLIGTDVTGGTALLYPGGSFLQDGVDIANGASYNRIGIDPAAAGGSDHGNVISGNWTGISIGNLGSWPWPAPGGPSDGNLVAGNMIGTDATGTISLPNTCCGISIFGEASRNTIGGSTAAAGNLIADNGGPGVEVSEAYYVDENTTTEAQYFRDPATLGNSITANRIFGNAGRAIDLNMGPEWSQGMAVETQQDSRTPGVGPNAFQNFPVLITGPGGQIEGWLGGSTPDTAFRVDVYASAAEGPDGSGDAQDFLGSMGVATDASGQVVFTVPFTAPAGLPIVTATATDPQGNTSEVTAVRPATLQVPPATLHVVLGQPLAFSTASGDPLAIEDPAAGPLDPTWSVTLSVSDGTLTLPRTAGLTGSGDGTYSLTLQGPLSAVDAALDGLTYTPPAGAHVLATLSVSASSAGATSLENQVTLTDGVFEVDTTADSGPGSLRQAIVDADGLASGAVAIDFDIPGAGVRTIRTATPLPAITTSLIVDGTTQPGYAGTPLIGLVGPSASSPLSVAGGDVTIRGLSLYEVAIAPTASADLIAVAEDQGSMSPLSLLDAQGRTMVQSQGVSSDAINEQLAAGSYSLSVVDFGTNAPTWTIRLAPAGAAFQPIPVGTSPDAIVAGDFNGDGHLDLAVANGGDNTVSILLGNGDGTFQPQVTYPVGVQPDAIVAGDFTGDGHLDLAVVNGYSDTVSVLLGNGDGTFRPQVTYGVGAYPDAIVAGEFSRNGRLDLAVANGADDTVSILLGNGDGTFQPQVTYRVGVSPDAITADDFAGNGRLDLAVANWGDDTVSVLLANGDGTFQPQVAYPVGGEADSVVAGDFTGDGHVDLAVGVYMSSYTVSVLPGDGDGTFRPPINYPDLGGPLTLVAGDFAGGGADGLAVLNLDGSVSFLLNKGDRSLTPEFAFTSQFFLPLLARGPTMMVAGDFTGDGKLDLAAVYPNFLTTGSVAVLIGNGDGSLQLPQQSGNAVGANPFWAVTGDFTGNGRQDLVVGDGAGTQILLGNGDGTFQPARTIAPALGFAAVAGDFNGDGRLDLAMADDNDPGTVSVLLGNGDGTFAAPVNYDVGEYPLGIVAGDFTGDGRLDLAVTNDIASSQNGTVSVLLGNGDGTFQPQVTYAVGFLPGAIVASDFTGDGRLDLAVANGYFCTNSPSGDSTVSVLMGNGDGTFQPQVTYPIESEVSWMTTGDFEGNGRQDLVIGSYVGNQLLINNGDGTFQPARTLPGSYSGGGVGDFNGDGKLDIAGAQEVKNDVAVMLGNGDGTFAPPKTYAIPGSDPTAIVAGDFNGSGHPGLATVNIRSNNVSVLLGNGDGKFTAAGSFVTTPHATPLVADVNGDGTDDVLVVDGSGNDLYRQGVPGQPGSFLPPVAVNAGFPSRDIAWVPSTMDGPLLASVDAHDDAISLYSWRNGGFVRIGSLATGQLPAQVIAADLNGNGLDDLVVRNAGDGTLTVYFNNGSGSFWTGFDRPFLPPVTIPVGLGVSDVRAIGTVPDGHLDLVVTNKLTGQVSVLDNRGDDTFDAPVPYGAGTGLSAIDAGSTPEVTSLDATAGVVGAPMVPGGPTDLVTINPGSNTLGVLAGLGGGSFANPAAIPTPGPAKVVRMADFNHDGIPDLAVLTSQGVSIYMGDGKGGFSSPTTYDAGTDPTGLSVADLLGNGQLDLLIGNDYGDVLVLVGNGDGTFRPFEPVKGAIALAVADLTGNGATDFVFADQSLNRVTVVYGSTNQNSSGPHVIGSQASGVLAPGAVLLADLNGDGIPDLVVANSGGNNVLVYPGLGNGQFGPSIDGTQGFPVGTDPTGLAVADLNGQPDLVVADTGSNDVSILLGQGNGSTWTLVSGPRIKTDAGPVAVAVGDLLGGTQTDLAVANSGADDVQIFPGVGGEFFNDQPQATRTIPVGQDPSALFLGDFNGLGPGLSTLNAGSNDGTLIALAGAANPVIQSFPTGGGAPTAGFAGDFTHDGFTDLVVGNNADGHLALLMGGAGGLSLSQTMVSAEAPNPTGLSFAGVSDGLLSFYVSTAGREAALHLTFDLEGGGGLESGLPGVTIAATGSSSPEAALSQATAGSVQQVSQLLNISGTALDLATTLLTVSVLPGSLESESNGEATATVGTTGFGQPMLQPRASAGPNGSDDQPGEEADAPGAGPSIEAERIPAWEGVSIGVDRAWERARAAIRELESSMAAQGDARTHTPSPAPSGPRTGPAERTPGSSATAKEPESSRADGAPMSRRTRRLTPSSIIDTVLASWEIRRPGGGGSAEPGPPTQPERAREGPPHRPPGPLMIAAWTATAGAAWKWKTATTRFRPRRSTVKPLRRDDVREDS
jgi:hypothetical protein